VTAAGIANCEAVRPRSQVPVTEMKSGVSEMQSADCGVEVECGKRIYELNVNYLCIVYSVQ